jgi:hypothetical protein
VHDGSLIAGGSFTSAGGVNASCIARWDGGRLAPAGRRDGPARRCARGVQRQLVAAGRFTLAGGAPRPTSHAGMAPSGARSAAA